MSWSEAKWVVDQIVRKTGRAPNNMRAFSVLAASETSAALRFLEPADSYDALGNLICSVGGVMVRMSTEGYPAAVNDGVMVMNNTDLGAYENSPFVVTGLTAGTKYYFSAFPYSSQEVFNLSSAGANRAECVPAGVEQVSVSVTIDDDSGFIPTVVTCVNETDPDNTQTAAVTAAKRTCVFAVPAGDTYHIAYGPVADYATPDSTETRTATAGVVTEYTGVYSYFTATIAVSCPVGAELTCTRGDVSYKATAATDSYPFTVHQAGAWMVRAAAGEESAQTTVSIAATGETKTVALAFFRSTIAVTYPAGSYLTCSSDGETLAADNADGAYTFIVRKAGVWEVKATDGVKSDESSVIIVASGEEKAVELTYFRATINVTYPQDCTLTCAKDDKILMAGPGMGSYQFVVREAGEWVVKISDGTREMEKTVSVAADGQTVNVRLEFVKIYGIRRELSTSSNLNVTPAWSKTDDAIGVTNFNSVYPWSEMKREILDTGDVMVKIPEFWYQRWQSTEWIGSSRYLYEDIRIATYETDGFEKHPGSGLYVGAYKTSDNNRSVAEAVPTTGQTRAAMRASAKSKGEGWGLIDALANSAIQMLFMVEFANTDSQQAIGRGYSDISGDSAAPINTGSCDAVVNLTGGAEGVDGKVDVVYRGIEGIWGNVSEWMDGLNIEASGSYAYQYVCDDPSCYADNSSAGYIKLGYSYRTYDQQYNIKRVGAYAGAKWAMLPEYSTETGSDGAAYPDHVFFNSSPSGWRVAARSGDYSGGNNNGLFFLSMDKTSTSTDVKIGSRLLYRPPQETA